MPFIDKSGSFTHGFECGIIWERMSIADGLIERVIHSENKEQIVMICEHFGYEYSFSDLGDGWDNLICRPIDISAVIHK